MMQTDKENNTAQSPEEEHKWYAARSFGNRAYVDKVLPRYVSELFAAPLVKNILFLRCSESDIAGDDFRSDFCGKLMLYCDPGTRKPMPIDDHQMRMFIAINSLRDADLLRIEVDNPDFFKGQRVRVIGGKYAGMEGVIKRIKGDRRLLVHISGVCAVATSFIHPGLLEPIEDR